MTSGHYVTVLLNEMRFFNDDSTAVIHFPTPLPYFGNDWQVALTEVALKFISTPSVLVCCNICTESYVNDRLVPLLRYVTHYPDEDTLYAKPYYIPIQSSIPISLIRFTFREPDGTVITSPIGTSLTLHFQKRSNI